MDSKTHYSCKEIKALRKEITPGEWESFTDLESDLADIHSNNDDEVIAMNMREADADFIAAAPAIIDQLLQEVENLEKWKVEREKNLSILKSGLQEGIDMMREAREERKKMLDQYTFNSTP